MSAAPSTLTIASVRRTLKREVGAWRLNPRFLLFGALVRLLPANSFSSVRAALYRASGVRIEPRVSIMGSLHLAGPGDFARRLTLREGCVIGSGVTFILDAEIDVGRDASIGPDVTLITATHGIGFGSKRMSATVKARSIRVETGAWIGVRALILPGVTVSTGCVVSAGAVVTNDAPANSLVRGNPAVVVEDLPFGDR